MRIAISLDIIKVSMQLEAEGEETSDREEEWCMCKGRTVNVDDHSTQNDSECEARQ